jgi:hypothetical protein
MKKIPKLKLHDKIYIAGLFDGEGSIMLFKRKNLQKGRKTPSYFLTANLRMTNFKAMDWINRIYNGTYGKAYDVPENKNWKPNREWKIEGSRCVNFLKQIYPYLKIKNKQAKIAFKFGKTINRHLGANKIDKKILQYRNKLCQQMKKLNKRGMK